MFCPRCNNETIEIEEQEEMGQTLICPCGYREEKYFDKVKNDGLEFNSEKTKIKP